MVVVNQLWDTEIDAAPFCPPKEVHDSAGPVYTEKSGVQKKRQKKHMKQVVVKFHVGLCM